MSVQEFNCWIVEKDRQYLTGFNEISGELRWSPYVFDAARMDNVALAVILARRIGGFVSRFNPITGKKNEFPD